MRTEAALPPVALTAARRYSYQYFVLTAASDWLSGFRNAPCETALSDTRLIGHEQNASDLISQHIRIVSSIAYHCGKRCGSGHCWESLPVGVCIMLSVIDALILLMPS